MDITWAPVFGQSLFLTISSSRPSVQRWLPDSRSSRAAHPNQRPCRVTQCVLELSGEGVSRQTDNSIVGTDPHPLVDDRGRFACAPCRRGACALWLCARLVLRNHVHPGTCRLPPPAPPCVLDPLKFVFFFHPQTCGRPTYMRFSDPTFEAGTERFSKASASTQERILS